MTARPFPHTAVDARSTVKAINRHVRKIRAFEGGRQFGVDFSTWRASYPHLSTEYSRAAEILTGRKGRYMPPVWS